ncbi:hypothetical protein T265_00738 [Opisthorchis viverrini]|uniref:Uncharacterized protein n=1 Tax=Opisthorchis viverrini TaxID=6198 RepID=A0A075A239_OPIVI|nr:hypothetical protein T265_00738 [Opisthorchis viverrini]KER33431.1 hypothetical protein T265_00738 [Opisthorchis viverrini]
MLVDVQSLNTPLTIQGEALEVVERFTYLGSCINSDCSVTEEVGCLLVDPETGSPGSSKEADNDRAPGGIPFTAPKLENHASIFALFFRWTITRGACGPQRVAGIAFLAAIRSVDLNDIQCSFSQAWGPGQTVLKTESIVSLTRVHIAFRQSSSYACLLGQPDNIPSILLSSGGMTVRHRKDATAERFLVTPRVH